MTTNFGYEAKVGFEAVKVKRHNAQGKLPTKGTAGASGYDLYAFESTTVWPRDRAVVSTGLSFEVPEGLEIQVRPRSGLAAKNGITVLNSPGTVDSDYRGEVKVILFNSSDVPFEISVGDRIAQAVVCYLPKVYLTEEAQLSDTERGTGGFGSTGVR